MRRLFKVKDALGQMVIGKQIGVWKISNLERAQRIKDLILNESWWARVAYVLDFPEPIITMLRFADTNTPCLGDVYDGMDTMVEKVASSSIAERNWSTYFFINLVKHNRLGSKKVEDLVFVHTNLHLLSRKNDHYKEGATKLWDVAPECVDLNATLQDLITVGDSGDDSVALGASNISGTMLGSNDLSVVGDNNENVDFLANPYDSELDSDAS